MTIDIAPDLRPALNGTPIEAATTVAELHAILGPPSRVIDPVGAAPVGHRNNQCHVYDAHGVYFIEHHYTRRIEGGTAVFWLEESTPAFTPRVAFNGALTVAGYRVPPEPGLASILDGCPVPFRHLIGGSFSAERDGFYVGIDSKGTRLPSGRRSKARRVVSLSFGWPHDNWGTPVGGT